MTIQIKSLSQHFRGVLFNLYVALTLKIVDEILWCYHSNKTSFVVLSHVEVTLRYVEEILFCENSNKTLSQHFHMVQCF